MKNTSHPHDREERGLTLIVVLFLVVVLGGLSFASLQEGIGAKAAVTQLETSVRALEILETGLLQAEVEVRTQSDPDGDGIGTLSGTYAGGSFTVVATHDPLQLEYYTLAGVGAYGLSLRRAETELRRIPHTPFVHALFAKNDLLVSGNPQTDAFDSRVGTWAAQAVNMDGAGPYADPEGDVGANNDLTVGGTTTMVRGDARMGPSGSLTINGSPTISGSTAPLAEDIELPDIEIDEYRAAQITNDNIQVHPQRGYDAATYALVPLGKDRVILTGGTYFFTDFIFEGQTELVIKGPCKIYATGTVILRGGSIENQTTGAKDLQLLVHPYPVPAGYQWKPGPKLRNQVTIEGGAASALVLYAPACDAILAGNGALYGAFVANNIEVKGTPVFHYDKALGYITWPTWRFSRRVYWIDRAVPPR